MKLYESCRLCPRKCGVNRTDRSRYGKRGFCGETDQPRVAYIGPHMGEEPPISGINGSGTVFFSGCSLKCSFCQNYQISTLGLGRPMDLSALIEKLVDLIQVQHVHNINFVTPDHFFPHVFELISNLRGKTKVPPAVLNTSGYQSIELLKVAEDYADIYLPDYKYSRTGLAEQLSECGDYPRTALIAIAEMVRQKGFLDTTDEGTPARRGVLVRHLILPGHLKNSVDALNSLFLEFGPRLPVSLMSQYYPVQDQIEADLNRTLTKGEFNEIYGHALDLGFDHLFVQFPEQNSNRSFETSPFLPDFTQAQPFKPKNRSS